MYRIVNTKTGETWADFYVLSDAEDAYDYEELAPEDYSIIYVVPCRGCGEDADERYDWYGISTGYWCEECYHGSEYPYRRDRYATIEYDGYGERLDDEF
jgi:hypothetical protein